MEARQKESAPPPGFEELHARTRALIEQSTLLREQALAVLRQNRSSSRQLRQELAQSSDDLWQSRHRESSRNLKKTSNIGSWP